jgi:neutral/alkaline ceramidase-like enzyme
MQRRRILVLAIVAVISWGQLVWAEQSAWKVGCAKACITPEKSLWMAGYSSRTGPSQGKLHDLWVKALALETTDGHKAVLVAADLLGIPRAMYDTICEELQEQCGLDRSQILLNCSHSHCTPVLADALFDVYPLEDNHRTAIYEYSAKLEKTIVAVIIEAFSGMEQATISAGESTAMFACNRRNNRVADVIAARKAGEFPKGPSDRRVPVLAVRASSGELKAVLFGYACHCTTLANYQWSGDYAGFAQIAIEKNHPQTQAMFAAGCGADQNPLPRRKIELCEQYGELLAKAVEDVLDGEMEPVSPKLGTAFEFVDLKFGEQPTAEELKATAAGNIEYQARWAKRMLGIIESGKPFEKSYRYPIQVWRLGGEYTMIAMGGEVVVDYSLIFADKYGSKTWVAGYTNDVMAYIPSHRIWKEGGYESGAFAVYGLPVVRWNENIEQEITDSVGRLVDKLSR